MSDFLNPRMAQLQVYPVEKMKALFNRVPLTATGLKHIDLSIGEPKHIMPHFIQESIARNAQGINSYPAALGSIALRQVIANWLTQRYNLTTVCPETEVLPVLGTREALFALAQAVLDSDKQDGLVLCPNPFYQIYEGAALLAGLQPYFINQANQPGTLTDWEIIPESVWQRIQLVFVCSPANPSGTVMSLPEWEKLFELSDKYGFIIAADECYSEIYFDESAPPLGALQAATLLGRKDYAQLVVFGSLSKRSNVPGMRSGYVAGDAKIMQQFLLYRTYHGSAMSGLVQMVSSEVWQDEDHVKANRDLYRKKFNLFHTMLSKKLPLFIPPASFYLWVKTPFDDQQFALKLLQQQNIKVLPGSFLARKAHGINPGQGFVRIALVASINDTVEAANRIATFLDDIPEREQDVLSAELVC